MKLRTMTVTQLTAYISRLIGDDPIMNACSVSGELSSFKQYPSGHVYFSLVDADAKLPCVMFRTAAQRHMLDFQIGDQVQVSGQLSVYQREGRYQMICQTLAKQGDGILHQRFMALKKSLAARGYFDSARKRPIDIVRRVGLITSPVGAAIEDFTSILARRNPLIEVAVYPSLVQGAEAVQQLIAGIDYFNRLQSVDVIVLTRGGGSLEDLWCFNDAALAEAICNSDLAVVSAVGHETDFTIADFVADMRAPTPSAAAELISPPLSDKVDLLEATLEGLKAKLSHRLEKERLAVEARNPFNLHRVIAQRIARQCDDVNLQIDTMAQHLARRISNYRQTVAALHQTIKLQNPQHILKRGFSYVTDKDNNVITSATNVALGSDVNIVLNDGELLATIKEVKCEKI